MRWTDCYSDGSREPQLCSHAALTRAILTLSCPVIPREFPREKREGHADGYVVDKQDIMGVE